MKKISMLVIALLCGLPSINLAKSDSAVAKNIAAFGGCCKEFARFSGINKDKEGMLLNALFGATLLFESAQEFAPTSHQAFRSRSTSNIVNMIRTMAAASYMLASLYKATNNYRTPCIITKETNFASLEDAAVPVNDNNNKKFESFAKDIDTTGLFLLAFSKYTLLSGKLKDLAIDLGTGLTAYSDAANISKSISKSDMIHAYAAAVYMVSTIANGLLKYRAVGQAA
ncbi:MAG: hypothetical protein WD068_03285 [Candidatus Babeliales bacterium]